MKKHALIKAIVAATMFMAASTSSAAIGSDFVAGTGSLHLSQDATNALDASGAYIMTLGADKTRPSTMS